MISSRQFIHHLVVPIITIIACSYITSQPFSAAASSVVSQNKTDGQQPLSSSVTHEIKMAAVELPEGQTAYKMLEYKIVDKQNHTTDITSRFSKQPTIPGPTIVLTEGDIARLTLVNEIGRGTVSLHTHGVHYTITSDGTLKTANRVSNEAATPEESYTYVWTAGSGTIGSWPWHDHTLGKDLDGTDMNGLFSSDS